MNIKLKNISLIIPILLLLYPKINLAKFEFGIARSHTLVKVNRQVTGYSYWSSANVSETASNLGVGIEGSVGYRINLGKHMFVKPQFTYNYSYIETPFEEEQFIYYISNYNERTFGINVGFKIIQSHGQAYLYSGIFSGLTSMDYESVNQLTKVQNNTSLYILGLEFTATQIRYILFLEIKYGRTPIKVNSSGSQYRFNVNVSDEIELNSISLGFKFK